MQKLPLEDSSSAAHSQPHAAPPRSASLGLAALQGQEDRRRYLHDRGALERRSVLRGLVLLAVLVLLFGFWRADPSRVFFSGWWRHW